MVFRILILACLVSFFSCDKNDNEELCSVEDCDFLNPYSFTLYPIKNGVEVAYGINFIVDGAGKSCLPEKLQFFISDDNVKFEEVDKKDEEDNSFVIENLDDGKIYFLKMINYHSTLDSHDSPIRSIVPGNVKFPRLVENPIQFNQDAVEDIRVSPNGNRFVFRRNTNDWRVGELNVIGSGKEVFQNAFQGEWNPNSSEDISFVQDTLVDILESLQGRTSRALVNVNINTGEKDILHLITDVYDFNDDVFSPEQYWIHEFHYSLDGQSIHLLSNKENGSINTFEKKVYENLFRLDLKSKDLYPISDFLSAQFDLVDFIEDPKNHGNFYLIGGENNQLHYYDPDKRELSPIDLDDSSISNIHINPSGDYLLFTSSRTGRSELWSYHLSTKKLVQVTNGKFYFPSFRWQHLSWISDSEFMVYINMNDIWEFAIFEIG